MTYVTAGPKILLEGQSDYVKYFPPNTSTAYILVHVYTTSPLTSFTVTSVTQRGHDDDNPSTPVFPSFVSNSPYEIVWRHNIRVPMPDLSANGVYEIEVVNQEREVASQTFRIHKAECKYIVLFVCVCVCNDTNLTWPFFESYIFIDLKEETSIQNEVILGNSKWENECD